MLASVLLPRKGSVFSALARFVPPRVIALAYKQLPGKLGPAELRHLPRSEAESGLTFAGFAVLACPLKPGAGVLRNSRPSLDALRNRPSE